MERYHIEGVMTNMVGGWLIALDRPYEGQKGDTLTIAGTEPPVPVSVLSVVESEDGAMRDIVVAPISEMHDARLLAGRDLVLRSIG